MVGEREEKYLTESYTKRGHSEFLTFFAHGRFKKKRKEKQREGWRGREEQLQDRFLFILLPFLPLSFSGRRRLAQGHDSLILVYRDSPQDREKKIGVAKLIPGSVLFSPTLKDNPPPLLPFFLSLFLFFSI